LNLAKLVDLTAAAVPCPYCDVALAPTSVRVAGLAIVVDAGCRSCQGEFAFDWPAGNALLHPALVDRATGAVHADGSDWYARRFAHLVASETRKVSVPIAVSGACHAGRGAILVDCLDFRYSHVLLKLMSAARHLDESPDEDVVVIVPKLLRWLVPAGVAVIEADLPLERGTEWVEGLDAAVAETLTPSATVRISPTISQPDVTLGDLSLLGEDLTPAPNVHNGGAPLQIGFALRSDRQHSQGDRLWLGPTPLWLRIARRLLPERLAYELLVRRQNRNFARLAHRVRERHPEARCIAFGIGKPHGLPDWVDDLRTPGPVREESHSLDQYRRCRVVVGPHGANLSLPSLLAGGVVDLVRPSQLPNVAQDLIIPHGTSAEPKLTLFRYRIVPEECTPDTVAAITLSLIDDADWLYRNMIDNRRAYEAPGWPRPISWHPVAFEPASQPARIQRVSRDAAVVGVDEEAESPPPALMPRSAPLGSTFDPDSSELSPTSPIVGCVEPASKSAK
jgi:hypothetical protein